MTADLFIITAATVVAMAGGLLIGYWWARGSAYANGYEDGQADQIPLAGDCADCGWEMPQTNDVMAMVHAAMAHTFYDCPARSR